MRHPATATDAAGGYGGDAPGKGGEHKDLGLIYLPCCTRENLVKYGNEATHRCVYLPSRSILRDGCRVDPFLKSPNVSAARLRRIEKMSFRQKGLHEPV